MLPVLLSLLIMSNSACIPGEVTLYEDMSYTISESDDTTCIDQSDNSILWTIDSSSNGLHEITTYQYTNGESFPEEIEIIDHYYYVSKGF